MKRVRVAPGRHVVVPAELAEKAARVGSTGLTRDQIRNLAAAEPAQATGVMLGGTKPLALSRAKARRGGNRPRNVSPAREDST
jgi:hypothetical protein